MTSESGGILFEMGRDHLYPPFDFAPLRSGRTAEVVNLRKK